MRERLVNFLITQGYQHSNCEFNFTSKKHYVNSIRNC